MEVVLDKTDAAHWVYKEEGAVNLVLAYSGSPPLYVGKVLRIRKASREVAPGSEQWVDGDERLIWKDNPDILSSPFKEIAHQVFVLNEIVPRLGPQHIGLGLRLQTWPENSEPLQSDDEKYSINMKSCNWRS